MLFAGWFPEKVLFAFQISLLLYFPTLNSLEDIDTALGILALFYFIPYIMMVSSSSIQARNLLQYFHSLLCEGTF